MTAVLRRRALETPSRPAYVFLAEGEAESERLSWAELDGRARAIAAALSAEVQPGERALLLYPPGLEFVAAFFGCLYAGVVAVPAYPPRPRRDQPRLQAILADASPRLALTCSELAETLAGFAARLPALAAVPCLATDRLAAAPGWEGPAPAPESAAFLQYTSGSTSLPKGVMVTHANLAHNSRMIQQAFRQDEGSVVVGWLPLYHDMGLIGNVLQPLWSGGRCVLMSPVAFLQRPRRWLEAIGRYGATTSGGPNFAYELCVRKVGEAERAGLDLSRWQVAFTGAEPVRAETLERFGAAFGPCGFRREAFYPCYGLAEATLFVSGATLGEAVRVEAVDAAALERHAVEPAGDGAARRLVSCGRAWSGQRIAIVDPQSGEELPADRVGEIWISGPSVARGYWGKPEATERDFRAVLASGEGPFLRTGDLGFVGGGELFVTGRLKDLIILRGRNHYPQDLELTAEGSHAALRPGCVAAFSADVDGEERLVLVAEVERHAKTGVEEIAAAVRQAVAEGHEVTVHEVVLVRAGTIPKTSSGKLQHHACRAGWLQGDLAVVGASALAAPTQKVGVLPGREELAGLAREERREALLSALTARVEALAGLGRRPAADEPLTALGIDSLSALELKAAVESALGVELPLAELLGGWGLKDVVERVLGAGSLLAFPLFQALPSQGGGTPAHAVSAGQRALWFLERLAPLGGAYNIAVAARVLGELDSSALRRAVLRLAERHPALRTRFHDDEGEPVRLVAERAEVDFQEEDAAAWSAEALARRLEEEAWRRFDLAADPLLRLRVFANVPGGTVLLFTVHHLVTDFASMAVIGRELGVLYREEMGGPAAALEPLEAGDDDFVRRQREMLAGTRGERLWSYWREALAGPPPDLDLATDRPRPPVQTYRGGARALVLPAALADGARALAATHGATLFATLLAVWQAQLGRYTGQEDFAVGSPTAGRGGPEFAGVVGYFVNPVPLRAGLAGNPAFAAHLERVRSAALAALEHADFPLALLAERLQPERDPSRPPLFQTMFALQRERLGDPAGMAEIALGEAGARIDLGGLALESVRIEERRAQFELSLRLAERAAGGLLASLEYNADLFDGATVERMLGHFRVLLEDAAAAPDRSLWDLPLLTEEEGRQVRQWSGSTAPYPLEQSLVEPFERRVAQSPAALAILHAGGSLTYAELDARADRLARRLRRLGVGPEVVVGLYAERSPELVTGLLAVLKAGGAVLPLEPTYPVERLAYMLEDAAAPVLLAQGHLLDRFPPHGARVVRLEEPALRRVPPEGPDPRPRLPMAPAGDALAWIIYTSGSTGRPKGVALTHRGLVNRALHSQEVFALTPEDAILQKTPIAYDFSIWEMLGPLAAGGRLVIARPGDHRDPVALARAVAEHRITLIHFVPSMLDAFLSQGRLDRCSTLRQVWVGGEALNVAVRDRFFELLPAQLENQYGPAEASIDVIWHRARPGEPRVPIGRPIPNCTAWVLDTTLWPRPIGVPGELCLGGVCLARGYLGRPGLTAERFVPDPSADGGRLYRTGDLARWLPDGTIEFLGRMDQQLKVRGVRIEPGEIESALLAVPGVHEAAVVVHDAPGAGRRLVAWLVADPPVPETRELRALLARRLPESVVPSSFAFTAALPRLPNNKVDRGTLARTPPPAAASARAHAAPRTAAEELLAGVWADLLGVERVGVHDDFFELGGHSLLATRLLARVSRLFGVDLPVATVFQVPTVAALAERIAEHRAAAPAAAPIVPLVPIARPPEGSPLSFAQRRLWFLDRLEPGTAVYNIPGAVRLTGPLRLTVLAAAVGEVVRRHEALRTVFRLRDGEPLQVVAPPTPPALPWIDLSGLPADTREAEAGRLARQQAARPFDLERGPLCRLHVLRLEQRDHRLVVNFHHAVADGVSLALFLRELSVLYEAFSAGAPSPLPEPPVQYADYAAWQSARMVGEVLEAQLGYWRTRLAGVPVLKLPADRPRSAVPTRRGGIVAADLTAGTAAALAALARREGATLFMVLLAAFQTLLARYTGEDVVPVGSPVANRQRPEIEELIGFFVNTLVLDARLGDDPPFRELLARVRAACFGAYEHQELPFERLVEELRPERNLAQNPLFQVMFSLEEPLACRAAGELVLEPRRIDNGTAKFDLTLAVAPADGGGGVFVEYDADLFDPATAGRFLAHWRTLSQWIAAHPEARLSELPLLAAPERTQLLVDWNAEAGRLPAEAGETTLHELFAAQAARTPEAEALIAGEVRWTYRELAERAGRLASELRRLGVGPEARVGVCLPRTADLVAALLAVLEAGGAYVPLDPVYPRERLAFILEDSGAEVLITMDGATSAVAEFAGRVVLLAQGGRNLEPEFSPSSGGEVEGGRRGGRGVRALPGNLAYLIYTSGSTGRPKGVAIEHRSAAALLHWARGIFSPRELSGVLASTSICFDLSVFEIFVPLAWGGRVVLADNALELSRLPAASEVSLINTVPSAMAELVKSGSVPPSVGTVNLAGEPIPPSLVEAIQALGVDLYNLYGPSEDTTYSTWALLAAGSGSPIGRPIAGTRAYLLDRWGAPVPAGVPGELYLGGAGLARGYLGQPELTAERFVPDAFAGEPGGRLYRTGDLARLRPDGALDFLGRLDHQVKVRGFRIELGEVETALATLPEVAAVVVTARGEGPERHLAAWVVPRSGAAIPALDIGELRRHLGERLPAHMVPTAWCVLAELPRTPNGKIDRRALPAPTEAQREAGFRAPGTATEQALAEIWREVLGLERVGLGVSFFELGGHSLLLTRVAARIEERFGVALTLRELFAAPTLETLAEKVEEAVLAAASDRDLDALLDLLEAEGEEARLPS